MRRGPVPPIQMGGWGSWTGRGRSRASCSETALSVVGDDVAAAQAGHDLEGVLEQVETFRRRGERNPELAMLLLEPRRAEGQLEAPMRRMVDGDCLCREHRRVPVRRAGDEEPEADARRHPTQCSQRRHALEGLARALAVHGLEVVEAPDAVEAEVLGEANPADELVPGHPLLGDIEAEPHLPSDPFSVNSATRLWKRQVAPSRCRTSR